MNILIVGKRIQPPQKPIDSFTMWLAANMTISTFSLGTLGVSIFELELRPAVLTILFFNLLSTLPVAWFSVFGARTGLRQMVFSRYSFGCACIFSYLSFYFRCSFPVMVLSVYYFLCTSGQFQVPIASYYPDCVSLHIGAPFPLYRTHRTTFTIHVLPAPYFSSPVLVVSVQFPVYFAFRTSPFPASPAIMICHPHRMLHNTAGLSFRTMIQCGGRLTYCVVLALLHIFLLRFHCISHLIDLHAHIDEISYPLSRPSFIRPLGESNHSFISFHLVHGH